ncbi:Uncharacterised protein [Candidatus Gugararchaeum adminiculabundum]|nr:Uncharacterised protein [Candidatus Gugararchaeum adminiculabundum]
MRSRKSMKGQSALEYLMTYSWALLILLVVLVLIYASGVFNPGRFTPRECTFQPAFQCSSYKLTDGGQRVSMIATNGLGFDIKIKSINGIKVTSTELGVTDATLDLQGAPLYYQNGANIKFDPAIVPIAQKAADNSLVRLDITIEYVNCETDPHYVPGHGDTCDETVASSHVMSGRIVAITEVG